jgi:hypothetical protein
MPLILPGNVASATASTGFNVGNSLRFNSADSAHLDLTDPIGNNYYGQFTFSFWVKRCKLGSEQYIVQSSQTSTASFGGISFNSGDQLVVQLYDSTDNLQLSMITNRLFRDVSAWYHIMVAFDLSDGTTADRIKIYVNGTRETSFATSTIPGSGFGSAFFINNTDPLYIGRGRNPGGTTVYSDFYLAQFLCVTADSGDTNGLNADAELIPTQVGEFDEDSPTIWKPIEIDTAVLGASLDMSDNLGTNGFFLDFADSSNLGNDVNGGADWDENNIAAADQAVDSPTNNFATFNPLENYHAGGTFSEGNAKYTNPSGRHDFAVSTIGMTAGKWYYEVKVHQDTDYNTIGISDHSYQGSNQELSEDNYSYAYYNESGAGAVRAAASNILTSMPDFGDGDIIGVAVDLDNHKLYFSKNGTFINSGDPTSGSTGTGAVSIQDLSSVSTSYGQGVYFFAAGLWNTDSAAGNYSANFGGCSAFTVSSAASDGNSYGNFEYAPPSGYLALCTKNLGSDGG